MILMEKLREAKEKADSFYIRFSLSGDTKLNAFDPPGDCIGEDNILKGYKDVYGRYIFRAGGIRKWF